MTRQEIIEVAKTHCRKVFGQTIRVYYCAKHDRWWSLEVFALPHGEPFGMLIDKKGEVLEDALDVDDE